MLFFLLISLLGFATVHSTAITPSPHLIEGAQPSPPPPQNLSTTTFDTPSSINSSQTPATIDPRFTYDTIFANEVLDKNSAYMDTLLALADLSTKGWTSKLKWEAQYSFSRYGDVAIRIHASQNPSTLEYRYAIWGLYFAIRETSANRFKMCVLTLYLNPRVGERYRTLGYVSLLGGSSLDIGSNNSTKESPELVVPTQAWSQDLALANLTASPNNTSLVAENSEIANLKIEINLLGKPLGIDAVFHTLYTGLVHLASWPQYQRIENPGFIQDYEFRTFLRWDSSYLTVQPSFEYRYAIAALARLAAYMYEQNRFEDARFVVYVDEIEVGRGWLYRRGVGGDPSSE